MNIGINLGSILEKSKMDRMGIVLQTMMRVFDEKSSEKAPNRGSLVIETERGLWSAFNDMNVKVEVKCATKVTSELYCLTSEIRIPALGSYITAVVERKLLNGSTGRTVKMSVEEKITG